MSSSSYVKPSRPGKDKVIQLSYEVLNKVVQLTAKLTQAGHRQGHSGHSLLRAASPVCLEEASIPREAFVTYALSTKGGLHIQFAPSTTCIADCLMHASTTWRLGTYDPTMSRVRTAGLGCSYSDLALADA